MNARAKDSNDGSLITNTVVILFMVVVGIGWYLSTRLKAPPRPVPAPIDFSVNSGPTPTPVPGVTSAFTGTIAALIAKGQTMDCQVESLSKADGISGNLWTVSASGRSNISMPVAPGITVIANVVYKDGGVYAWYDMTGKKLGYMIDAQATSSGSPAQKRQIAQVLTKDMSFSCKEWEYNPVMFTLPPDVNFR